MPKSFCVRHLGIAFEIGTTILERYTTGRMVAREVKANSRYLLEESPGSMDRLPGNAWARSCLRDGQCHRKRTADGLQGFPLWDQVRLKR